VRKASEAFRVAAVLVSVVPAIGADRFDGVRDFIRKGLVETGMPSVSVAVVKNGTILWEEGFGWADREKRVRATEHTMYSLASISKPFTATGLMVLAEQGKLDLDRPINDYLGSAKLRARVGDAAEATVRRVANHSSGLPLHVHFFYQNTPRRPPPMDETILRYGNLVTAPGERFQYSNLGFGILDYVIERVSGKTYADFMRERIFIPLGLTHTSVHVAPGLESFASARYGRDGLPSAFYEFDHTGASAIWSSAHDLALFGMFHLKAHRPDQKTIISDESIDAMQKPTFPNGRNVGYGIAWVVTDSGGGYRVISHNGAMQGVATTLRLVPAENLVVTVLCNGSDQLPHRIADEIFKEVLPNWRQPERPPDSRPAVSLPAELKGAWTGTIATYKRELPFTLRVLDSGDIHAQIGGQTRMLVNEPRWENGYLSGDFIGDLGTEDTGPGPARIALLLKLRGTVLNGSATATALPGMRGGFNLSHWTELRRN
jgi:CubicO group peptidase (beta-lactamase class C family)